jgi:branched-subunit amino acid aminotransferase/4-amino-4-deoxychorismate lyase
MRETETIWMNGEFIDWHDAKVHVGVHGLHYGTGVFEGIRCYETPDGPAVFRLREHLERLDNSARLLYMELPYSIDEIRAAMHELIGRNGLAECYVRPFAFYGYGELGVHTKGNPVEVAIMSWPWANYLGDDNASTGIRAKISSWNRIGANTIPHVAKATGIYLNSMLAVHEAQRAGYDEAILLTAEGFVADGSGENVFLVKDGAALDLDPARDHAGQRDPDRAGSRLRRRGGQRDPLRPLSRRRDLHDRHSCRGDAGALGGRPRRRRRAGHARAPEGISRHCSREERALGALARPRLGR